MGIVSSPMFLLSLREVRWVCNPYVFGFRIGMMFASFHVRVMMLLFNDVVYMLVRYESSSGPMCLRCLMLTLSGPMELLFLLYFIVAWACVVVSVMLVVCSLSVLSMCLFVLCVLCLTVLVNCLLNAFAIICAGEGNVFYLKVFLANPCIDFQRVCVLCLGSQCVSRCSLHVSFVCWYEGCDFRVNSEIEGSLALCALMLFLCSILCLMCSGSSLHVECILPFVCLRRE